MKDQKPPVVNVSKLTLEHWTKGTLYESRDTPLGALLGLKSLGAGYNEVPPGKSSCPFHSHHVEDEMFVILEGHGTYRFGGEEFVVVLDRTLPDRAQAVAERVRADFAAKLIPAGRRSISCTVSAGIAFGNERCTTFDSLLSNADKALYMSKRNGRNRVSLAA